MFTGIIESVGSIVNIVPSQSNLEFEVQSAISNLLKVDQSVNHNGVCLTVTWVGDGRHRVTLVDETLKKTNLGSLRKDSLVNLERSMLNNGRFDGHIVQGHVDQTARVTGKIDQSGSWLFSFEHKRSADNVTVEKGSICVNGVSLTCFNSTGTSFDVAIIPYTYENTNFKLLNEGDTVNLEFDIIGKYVKRLMDSRQ